MVDEHDVDAEKLVYLMILGFVLDEIEAMFPRMDISPGTRGHVLAERIAARLVIEADMMEILE